jgi:hypothetical protein
MGLGEFVASIARHSETWITRCEKDESNRHLSQGKACRRSFQHNSNILIPH